MEEQWEQRIVLGLRAGDARAWNEFYDVHAQRVWRAVAQRLGESAGEVADVVQEVFLDAARSAHNYRRQSGTLTQWLNGIVRRKVALHWRRRERQDRIAGDEVSRLLGWLDGKTDDPPEIVASAELADAVRETLRQLPEDYEHVLVAKYASGESARQIAADMGVSTDSVRSKLKRARQQFRRKFPRQHQSIPRDTPSCGFSGTRTDD